MAATIATFAVRAFQILSGAVVLGLSIHAIQWQIFGSSPSTTEYASFVGAVGLLIGLIGIAAIWISALGGLVMAIIDGAAAIFFLAGGVAFAVGIKGVSCGNLLDMAPNFLLNGGCKNIDKSDAECGYPIDHSKSTLTGRCQTIEADTAFMFIGCVASLAGAILCMFAMRRSRQTRSAV